MNLVSSVLVLLSFKSIKFSECVYFYSGVKWHISIWDTVNVGTYFKVWSIDIPLSPHNLFTPIIRTISFTFNFSSVSNRWKELVPSNLKYLSHYILRYSTILALGMSPLFLIYRTQLDSILFLSLCFFL